MTLSFKVTDDVIPHGRKTREIPAYVGAAIAAALKAGKNVETTAPKSEIHTAALAFRRYKKLHPEYDISVSETAVDEKSGHLLVSVKNAEK